MKLLTFEALINIYLLVIVRMLHSNRLLTLSEDCGLYSTILPVFGGGCWNDLIPQSGFVWIQSPHVDLSGKLDSVVAESLFDPSIDARCSIHRFELDVSIAAIDFLRVVDSVFPHGMDFVYSENHQPANFQLQSIPKRAWPEVMAENQIRLTFHRPAAGEYSLVTSHDADRLRSIIERFSRQ